MPVPPTSISAATITSHAMPMEMRMPVRIVGAAAGRMIVNARRNVPTSSVFATLSHSRRTEATPNAVLIIVGHNEQMQITKIDERLESLIVYSASGIQASGEIGLSTWMKGSSALLIKGDMPMRNPAGTATAIANRYPVSTRAIEKASW